MSSNCYEEAKRDLVRMVAPFAPCVAEELWKGWGMEGSVFDGGWPEFNEAKLKRESVVIAVMVRLFATFRRRFRAMVVGLFNSG